MFGKLIILAYLFILPNKASRKVTLHDSGDTFTRRICCGQLIGRGYLFDNTAYDNRSVGDAVCMQSYY